MSTVPPGPYPQSTPSAGTPPSSAPPKKVGTSGYWIALAIFFIGCGIAVVWFIVSIVGVVNAPNDFARESIPGSMAVELSTGDWVLYHEAPGINRFGGFSSSPDVVVTGPSGSPVTLNYSNFHTTYSNGAHDGTTLASFHADRAGVYTIDISDNGGGSSEYVAIGRPLFKSALPAIIGSVALGVVCFIVALVLFIVTLVRRGRSKRALAAAPYQPVPTAPGAPGSFAAPIPTAPVSPQAPVSPGPPPGPGSYGAPVPPPPVAAPSGSAYTPGWAAPADSAAPVPPPPAPTGFASPGSDASAPSDDLGSWPPPPSEPSVAVPPAPPAPPVPPAPPAPPAPESASPGSTSPDAGAEAPTDGDWDKPGTF